MGLIVQKFGGTSVGSVDHIQNVANRVIAEKNNGNDIVVVVSAMGKTTDQLVGMAQELSASPSKREMDMLLSTGEQVTISLLTIALNAKGYEATSFTGWQAGIKTESVHGDARITDIDTSPVAEQLQAGKIVIVAGFQGLSETGQITTLGRGGSDTTAVALAAVLKADKCDIYTDVTGVFTTDPRYIKDARKLSSISYDEMLELANLGAGVLHPRAVEFAKNYGVKLVVRSSMEREEGTLIEEDAEMEENLVVRGVAFEDDITRVSILGIKDPLTSLSAIFSLLAKEHINVDIIIQSITDDKASGLSFSIKNQDLTETVKILEKHREVLSYDRIEWESQLAKISIVGSGMISNPGVAAEMFNVLAANNIVVKMVSTSEIKVSAVIDQVHMLDAAQTLHNTFHLAGNLIKN